MPPSSTSAGAVTIQVVLDRRLASTSLRWLAAAAHAASVARREARLTSWEIALAMPDDVPGLDRDDVARLEEVVLDAGGALELRSARHELGTAARHNLLAGWSGSDTLLFLEAGAVMAPDTIERLCDSLTTGVGLVGARELPLGQDREFAPFLGDTSWVSTACALTPRATFVDLGGFDADTFADVGADVDFSWRVRLSGLRVLLQPASRVFRDRRLRPNGDEQPQGWDLSTKPERRRFRSSRRFDVALAELLLAHKYADQQRATELRAAFAHAEGAARRALAEYDRRRAAGLLPAPVHVTDQLTTPLGFRQTGRGL